MSKERITHQRAVILDVLERASAALSAETVWQKARESCPNLALTTVYRNLERLSVEHAIRALPVPEGATRYVAAGEHRHFLICMGCDRTVDLKDCPLSEMEEKLEKDTGFTIAQHSLELYGYCAECKAHRKDKEHAVP